MKKDVTHKNPTESDVARLAGVSQSAVSRAFTPGASIAEKTREKVLKAAEEVGYHPNLLARSLVTNRSNIIALAISYLENPFYAQVVRELSRQLRESDRHILLFSAPDGNQPDPDLEKVLRYQVDALIMTGTKASPELKDQCRKAGVPIVQINRKSDLAGISTVCGEDFEAGQMIAQHLLDGGHKRYAYIGGTEGSNTSRIREEGFRDQLKKAGIKDVQVRFGSNKFEAAAVAVRELLTGKTPPDAIFCASDYMAFAAMDVARNEFGLKVPEDISVVGFNDVPDASHAAYNLTTYSQPANTLVEEAVKLVDDMIANPKKRAQRREVPGELIIRSSSRHKAG